MPEHSGLPIDSVQSPDLDVWVSIRAVAWVIDEAPVPADLAFTLTVIARRCDANGRGSYQSIKTIAEKTGKSEDQAARDIKRLRELGLVLLGDQSLPAKHGVPKGRRPVVYDLPLGLKGPKPAKASKNVSGQKKESTPRMDATTGMDATPSGVSNPLHESTPTPRMDAGPRPRMDAPLTSCMDAPQITLKNPGKKTSINPVAEVGTDVQVSAAETDGLIGESSSSHNEHAARIADDLDGRRWLVKNLLLADDHAAEVVAVIRRKYPTITCMPRYLERMHRAPDGTTKPELLNIVEAVQKTGQQPAAEFELEESSPERETFARPQLCTKHRDAPEDPRPIGGSRCLLCNDQRRKADRTASEQTAASAVDEDAEAAKGFQLMADMIAKGRATRERGERRKTGYKAAVRRLPHNPDPALDAEREAVIRGEGHRELPEAEVEPVGGEEAASA